LYTTSTILGVYIVITTNAAFNVPLSMCSSMSDLIKDPTLLFVSSTNLPKSSRGKESSIESAFYKKHQFLVYMTKEALIVKKWKRDRRKLLFTKYFGDKFTPEVEF
jgi:hypothetical protein